MITNQGAQLKSSEEQGCLIFFKLSATLDGNVNPALSPSVLSKTHCVSVHMVLVANQGKGAAAALYCLCKALLSLPGHKERGEGGSRDLYHAPFSHSILFPY